MKSFSRYASRLNLFQNKTVFYKRKTSILPRVTIQHVARRANVSPATVPRVLNHKATVATHLRERVLAAADELGYMPDRAARRLRAGHSDVLGLIVGDIQNPHFVSVIQGVQDAAHQRNMNIILCDSDESSERIARNAAVLRAESVAGLIVVPTPSGDYDTLKSLQDNNIPLVLLDRPVNGLNADTVMSDNVAGACTGVQHLIKLGRRRIAGIFPDIQTGRQRREGFIKAHIDAGLPAPDESLMLVGSYRAQGSYEVVRALFAGNPPDAIFTATNLVTLGVIRAMRELGIRSPQDIALVGFDDMPWADELFIPYTALAQQTYRMGATAVERLMDRIDNPRRDTQVVRLPVELIIRDSCGAKLTR
ncbi:MAG: LacI family DNA-binding transcriptional regulator [Chloroflexota bacterium]